MTNPVAEVAPPPFDPSDPFDAMAESARRQVCEIAIEMMSAAVFRDLDPVRQVECLMGGMATGMIGVLFAHIVPEGRDEMMQAIIDYLPQARLNAENIHDA